MASRYLRQRVYEGIRLMREGEETTIGKVAALEGVSKSPQLYGYFDDMVHAGMLKRELRKHSNGHDMFVFIRTSKNIQLGLPAFESEGD